MLLLWYNYYSIININFIVITKSIVVFIISAILSFILNTMQIICAHVLQLNQVILNIDLDSLNTSPQLVTSISYLNLIYVNNKLNKYINKTSWQSKVYENIIEFKTVLHYDTPIRLSTIVMNFLM